MSEKAVQLKVERDADITIILILSPRVAVDMSDSFEQQVVRTIDGLGTPKVLIDFGGVQFISSAVLGKLIKLNGRVVTDRGGQLKLSSLTEKIAEVFKITGLEKLFSIHGTRGEALQAFE